MDTLLRPYTDVGGVYPSSLVWKYDPQKAIPHIIIGRGRPGGSWQYMEPNLKSLSLGSWLDLPLYSFSDWTVEQQQKELNNQQSTDFDHMTKKDVKTGRVLVGSVAEYYADYVVRMGLSENFVDNAEIDQVTYLDKTLTPVHTEAADTSGCSSCSSPQSILDSPLKNISRSPQTSCVLSNNEWEHFTNICSVIVDAEDYGIHCPDDVDCIRRRRDCTLKWYLRGSQKSSGRGGSNGDGEKNVCIFSKKLVLACGVSGRVRWLGVPGEESPFITHSIPEFVEHVNICRLNEGEGEVGALPPVVVVVGAGLSAADAVLSALGKGLKVIHVFHQNPNDQHLVFDRIPKRTYPGYGHLHGLMKGKVTDECYVCCSESRVCEFNEDEQSISTVNSAGLKVTWTNISLGGVFIGTDVELGFLPDNLVPQLATDVHAPINVTHNPVDVNQISFVCEAVPSLYAIGSLTGDNFVRFGIGSALGAAQHILGLKPI